MWATMLREVVVVGPRERAGVGVGQVDVGFSSSAVSVAAVADRYVRAALTARLAMEVAGC